MIPNFVYKYKSIEGDSFAFVIDIFQRKRIYKPLINELNDPCEGFFQYIGNGNDDQDNIEEQDYLRIIRNSRILAFSECYDSNAMWAYYTKEHKGICIEFSTKKIFTDVNPLKKEYTKRIPNIEINQRNYYRALLYKSKEWEHEKEWRHISSINNQYIELGETCITKVLLGAKIDELKKKNLIQIIEHNYPKASIFQMGFSRRDYRIINRGLVINI